MAGRRNAAAEDNAAATTTNDASELVSPDTLPDGAGPTLPESTEDGADFADVEFIPTPNRKPTRSPFQDVIDAMELDAKGWKGFNPAHPPTGVEPNLPETTYRSQLDKAGRDRKAGPVTVRMHKHEDGRILFKIVSKISRKKSNKTDAAS